MRGKGLLWSQAPSLKEETRDYLGSHSKTSPAPSMGHPGTPLSSKGARAHGALGLRKGLCWGFCLLFLFFKLLNGNFVFAGGSGSELVHPEVIGPCPVCGDNCSPFPEYRTPTGAAWASGSLWSEMTLPPGKRRTESEHLVSAFSPGSSAPLLIPAVPRYLSGSHTN